MNAADRLSHELAQEQQREQQQDDDLRRRAAGPTLVYKDHITETPPSPPSPRSINAEISKQLARQLKDRDRMFIDVVAEFVALRGRKLREQLRAEDAAIKDALNTLRAEVNTLRAEAGRDREQADRERAINRQAAETDKAEREALHRTISALREELALEHGLRTLNDEVATARSEIPNFNALEGRFKSKQSLLAARQSQLEHELTATKDKLATLRAQHSETQYGLKQLEDQHQAKAGIELRFDTPQSSFSIRDMHPLAREAWKRFVADVLGAPQDEAATMLLIDPAQGSA